MTPSWSRCSPEAAERKSLTSSPGCVQGRAQMSKTPSSGRAWGRMGKPVPYSLMLPTRARPGAWKRGLWSTVTRIEGTRGAVGAEEDDGFGVAHEDERVLGDRRGGVGEGGGGVAGGVEGVGDAAEQLQGFSAAGDGVSEHGDVGGGGGHG